MFIFSVLLAATSCAAFSIPPQEQQTFQYQPVEQLRRIKETTGWCEPDARSWAGWINTSESPESERWIWFHYFEARVSAKKHEDDVVLFLSGGPGASSSTGLFIENGPCRYVPPTANTSSYITPSPTAWNQEYPVLFIDSPLSVGWSYSTPASTPPRNTPEAAQDVVKFLELFFQTSEIFGEAAVAKKKKGLHISGESFSGRYIPVFASAIQDFHESIGNQAATYELKSIILGNPMVDPITMFDGYAAQMCTNSSGAGPIAPNSVCSRLYESLPRCKALLIESCAPGSFDAVGCATADSFCKEITVTEFFKLGRGWFDVSESCSYRSTCKSDLYMTGLDDFLNSPETRSEIGTKDFPGNFTWYSDPLEERWEKLDEYGDTPGYVGGLLERGIRVLVMVGKLDFACNWVGNEMMLDLLEWGGAPGWIAASFRDWSTSEVASVAGEVKSSGALSFVTVIGAGHMAPTDKPEEVLYLLHKWIKEKEF